MNATIACKAIIKIVALRKPIESYNKPLNDGPKNAPSANVDVHRPETKPYVSILSGIPQRLTDNKNEICFFL